MTAAGASVRSMIDSTKIIVSFGAPRASCRSLLVLTTNDRADVSGRNTLGRSPHCLAPDVHAGMPRRDPRGQLRFREQRADQLGPGASCRWFKPSKLDAGIQPSLRTDFERISEDLHSFRCFGTARANCHSID